MAVSGKSFRTSDHPSEARVALDQAAIRACRANGIPVAFDPAVTGWVPLTGGDARMTTLTPRVRLRPWLPGDAARYRAMLDEPGLWTWLPERYPGPIDIGTARDLIALANEPSRHVVRAVIHGGAPVGQVRLEYDRSGDRAAPAELGYWIGRQHRGRGFAKAAVVQTLRDRHGIGPVIARVHRDNAASRRVLDHAGFRPTTTECQSAPWIWMRHD